MHDAANTGRGKAHAAGFALGERDQFFDVVNRQLRRHADDIRVGSELGHRSEIAHRIVVLRFERGGGNYRAAADQQRMTVGRGFRHQLNADTAAGAGAVVDYKGLAPQRAVMLGSDAGQGIHTTTGRNIDNDAHRALRIGRCVDLCVRTFDHAQRQRYESAERQRPAPSRLPRARIRRAGENHIVCIVHHLPLTPARAPHTGRGSRIVYCNARLASFASLRHLVISFLT